MKSKLLAVALTLCLTSPLWAQDASSDSGTPPPAGGGHHWGGPDLTADERTELKAAHDAAIQANPDLATEGKQLHDQMEAYQQKLHDAMVKADPKVEAILAKMPHHHGPPPGDAGAGGQ
jgi:Spy/CpxP family protein refolding chaperone